MAEIKTLTTLYRFRKLIAAFVIVIGFFSFYNLFLIDRTLENLSFALEQTAAAYDIEGAAGLELVLTQPAVQEISPIALNSLNFSNLEFAKSSITTGKNYRQLDYAATALRALIGSKEKDRGIVLAVLDKINRPVRKGFIYLAYLPRYLLRPRLAEAQSEKAPVTLLERAKVFEKENALESLALTYEEFISSYPQNKETSLVMLRLGYTYHRLGKYDKARKTYKITINRYFPDKNAKVAQILLDSLKQKDSLLKEINRLLIESNEAAQSSVGEKQDIFYKLGIVYAGLFNFEDSARFFKRAYEANPTSDSAIKSQFNMAWMHKNQFKLEKSTEEFAKIKEEKPESGLVLDSRYQMADILHAEGKYEESIGVYEKMAKDYTDAPVAALCLFQIGASYMYDLNDTEKGEEIFGKLIREYPDSAYAKYLAPDNPVGMFIIYLVPRATRIVAWRASGLLCLSGFSGELVTFKAKAEQAGLNNAFNDWLRTELPDTVGNLWVDVKGTEITLEKGKAAGSGQITMGKFNVAAEAEGHLKISEEGGMLLVLTKAILGKIPIPPILLNRTVNGIMLIARKYFPVTLTRISFDEGEVNIEGFGSKRILERIKSSTKKLLGVTIELEDIKDPDRQKEMYGLYKEKFPESEFSPAPVYDTESLFLDFFTRMSFFSSFVLLEAVKDSKLDYERSIRTLGRLMLKEAKFGVTYKESDINVSLGRYISTEFPWLINDEFLFDVKGLEIDFKENGEIRLNGTFKLGHGKMPIKAETVSLNGIFSIAIDKKTRLPHLLFKEVYLNGKSYPAEKLNLVTSRSLGMLKDANVPIKMDRIDVTEGGVTLKGKGARDFTNRLFKDPYIFVIFQIRQWDLPVAGIERLDRVELDGAYWRGRGREELGRTADDMGTENITWE